MRYRVLLLCIAACGACGHSTVPGPISVTEAQTGGTVGLVVGQELSVSLASNPTTGYGWTARTSRSAVIEPKGERRYVADQPVRPGSGGRDEFRFIAVAAGTTDLRFEYARAFEPTVPPIAVVAYDVIVR